MLLALVASASHARAQVNRDVKTQYPVTDPKYASAVVARIGDLKITSQQFLISYEFGPAFVKRQKDSKRRFLEFMIYEKLLALDAYSRGVESSTRVAEALAEIEGDLATEELYKDDILSKVTVSEREIDNTIRRQQSHISLQWLYAATKEQMQRYNGLLHVGVAFDSLFALQVKDSVTRDDRSLETTRFKLEQTNPDLARVVDTLNAARTSAPVKGPDGWYIIKIVDGWRDVLPTESAEMKLRDDAQRAVVKQKSDSLSDQYIRRMMLEQDPVIVRTTFDVVQAYVGKKFLSRKVYHELNNAKVIDVANIEQHERNPLVRLKQGDITLKDFLAWFRAREAYMHPVTSSPQSFFVWFQQMVWRMIRDRLLVERAHVRQLEKREIVQSQKKWWEEKILYEIEKSSIADSINTDDLTLQKFYHDHEQHYRSAEGAPVPFERVREEVQKDFFSSELTKRLFHRILTLKKKYDVEIREEILRDLPVDAENQPRAIDVYAVKKGGTFPRPAFPTIDYQWQAWN